MDNFKRTCDCGKLKKQNVDQKVRLSGWVHRRRDHGGLIFIDLRDRFGITQLIFDPKISKESHLLAEKLRQEWVISVHGKVRFRGEGLINPKLSTGEIEIEAEDLIILSASKTPPFSICDEKIEVHEELRLKYRFLDLRRKEITQNLVVRHKVMQSTRNFLSNLNFLEITTPILAKTTPEGARDYLVPSRIYPGNFFALPQSPQIFKQLLMISGMDRYFQIATCFRDEDLRADRQPEFSQIDIEMSFSDPEELFPIIENLMQEIFNTLHIKIKTSFKKLSHKECLEKYGTDKPDLRFGMKFHSLSDIIEESEFSLLKEKQKEGAIVKGICVKGGALFSRKQIDALISFVGKFSLQGLAWMKKTKEGFSSNIVKFFSENLLHEIEKRMDVDTDDLILIAAEKESIVNQALDHLRRHIAKKQNLIKPHTYEFLWVTDFPLFKIDEKTNQIETEHHPFTSPHFDDIDLMDTKPLEVRALAYDLVLNGYEIASGSQRIHSDELQKKIFQTLRLTEEEIKAKFGFFVEALKYGTPPHLGIALGFDRIIMVLCNTENIREVIAFPKLKKQAIL